MSAKKGMRKDRKATEPQKAPRTVNRADRSREHEKAAKGAGIAGSQRPPDDS
jgi:hypothetical protein